MKNKNYEITKDGKGFIVLFNQCGQNTAFSLKASVFKRMEEQLGLEFRGISVSSYCPTCKENDSFIFSQSSSSDDKLTKLNKDDNE